jgi:alkanesulfonate monooxygenase SsuD/methylene tetrahydromethanopterin reductase-like flavin-dependent oxidoreductase (luciferase family)
MCPIERESSLESSYPAGRPKQVAERIERFASRGRGGFAFLRKLQEVLRQDAQIAGESYAKMRKLQRAYQLLC